MVRIASIRLLPALIAHLDLELFQMDVKITFLNENLEEEIYMDQPIGFVSKGQEEKVCHLKRSIYGLKQSSRAWYFRFHEVIISFGLNMEIIQTTTQWLSFVLEMKDIGNVRYVLGVKITLNYSKKLLGLSEEAYINKMSECFRMHCSKPETL